MMRSTLTLMMALLFSGCLPMGGTQDIRGTIYIKGHLPQSYVSLKVSSHLNYNVVGRLSPLLRSSYQGKEVTLRGRIISEAVGPGMPARFQVTNIVAIHRR